MAVEVIVEGGGGSRCDGWWWRWRSCSGGDGGGVVALSIGVGDGGSNQGPTCTERLGTPGEEHAYQLGCETGTG